MMNGYERITPPAFSAPATSTSADKVYILPAVMLPYVTTHDDHTREQLRFLGYNAIGWDVGRLNYRLHVLIYPAIDLPGQWLAHCLDLDLVSQGNSEEHALEMISEAISLSAKWAIEEGRPALEMRPAPAEDWDLFEQLERQRRPITKIIRIEQLPSDVVIEPVISSAL